MCDGYVEGSLASEAVKKPAWSLVVCKAPFKSGSLATRASSDAKHPRETESGPSFPAVNRESLPRSHQQPQGMLHTRAEEVPEELEIDRASVLASVSQVDPSASNGRRFWTIQAGPLPNVPCAAEGKMDNDRQQLASPDDPSLDEEVPEELAAAGACEPGLLSYTPGHTLEVPDEVESDYESSGSMAAEDVASANLDEKF